MSSSKPLLQAKLEGWRRSPNPDMNTLADVIDEYVEDVVKNLSAAGTATTTTCAIPKGGVVTG